MTPTPLPFAFDDFPGVGGRIKVRDEDFFVQEVPLYEPSGEGEHVYCEVEKVGLPTFEAVNRVARALGVGVRDVGYAGLKDARAVSRQMLSVWGTTEEAVMALRVPGVTVRWARRHGNKLRLGHLAGNRFAIKVRDVDPADVVRLRGPLAELRRRGVPNYFGEQRFGRRGDNDRLGAAVVRGDDRAVLQLLLGSPDPSVDDPQTLRARQAYERRDNDAAMHAWPRHCGMERRVLARLMKSHKPSAAVRSVDERLRRLWVSALQSKLFNDVLARRVAAGTYDRILPGDLAYKHDNGACFAVAPEGDDPATAAALAAEQARAAAFEISPSGPLLGYRMTLPPGGAPLADEQAVFAAAGLAAADFRGRELGRVKGARRPLRVRPDDVDLAAGVDGHGPHITVAFTLPAGAFATVVMRELMKSDAETAGPAVGRAAAAADDDDAAEVGDDPRAAEPPLDPEHDTPDGDAR